MPIYLVACSRPLWNSWLLAQGQDPAEVGPRGAVVTAAGQPHGLKGLARILPRGKPIVPELVLGVHETSHAALVVGQLS